MAAAAEKKQANLPAKESPPLVPPTKNQESPVVDTSKAFESTDGSTPDEGGSTVGRKLSSKFSGFLSKNKEPPKQKEPHKPSPKSLTPS